MEGEEISNTKKNWKKTRRKQEIFSTFLLRIREIFIDAMTDKDKGTKNPKY